MCKTKLIKKTQVKSINRVQSNKTKMDIKKTINKYLIPQQSGLLKSNFSLNVAQM